MRTMYICLPESAHRPHAVRRKGSKVAKQQHAVKAVREKLLFLCLLPPSYSAVCLRHPALRCASWRQFGMRTKHRSQHLLVFDGSHKVFFCNSVISGRATRQSELQKQHASPEHSHADADASLNTHLAR